MHRKSGWIIVWVLGLLPLSIWLLQAQEYTDVWVWLSNFGKITGLVGMSLFALSFILSTRWRWLEPLFGGLNRVYVAHHLIGGIAFILLLSHPILLALGRVSDSFDRALRLLLPTREASIYGWLSLGIMILFLYITFFTRLPYKVWRYLHLLSGPAFLFGMMHVYQLQTDVQANPLLFVYMTILFILGTAAYLYRLLMTQLVNKKLEYEISTVNNLGGEVIELTLSPLKKKLKFESGQFVYVSFYDPESKEHLETHPFSITSSPAEDKLGLVIKSLGDDTRKMMVIREGSWALIEGPYGRFSFHNAHAKKQIWVAGGIGVTPFLSMARSLTKREKNYDIDFYYSVETKNEDYFLDELRKIDLEYDNFRLFMRYADTEGFLTSEYIRLMSGKLEDTDILLCGPPVMMKALSQQLQTEGVKVKNIYTEEFGFN